MSWPLDLFDKVLIVSKIHLLTESSIEWLKQQAKTLKKSKSIALSQAQYEIAVQHGFLNWKNLVETFKYETSSTLKYRIIASHSPKDDPEILAEYTDEQKIGSIARNLGINPQNIQNSIFVTIENSEDVFNISLDEWESLGFYEDYSFVRWLEENDFYFQELGIDGQIFRIIAIDTNSYKTAERQINRILKSIAKKHDFFFPIISGFIWINGKIDPLSIEIDPEYPNDLLPLAELPESAWKRGY